MYTRYELDAAIDHLVKRKDTKPLAKKLIRLRNLYSIRIDLERTQQAVSTIVQSMKDRNNVARLLTPEEALMDASIAMLAIITYARSTDTGSDRGRFDPRRFYSDTMKEWHKGIIDLRNEAIAHFGSGRHPAGDWAEDHITFVVNSETGQGIFGWTYNRSNYRGKAITELRDMLPYAIDGLQQDIKKAEQSAMSEADLHHEQFSNALDLCKTEEIDDAQRFTHVEDYVPIYDT